VEQRLGLGTIITNGKVAATLCRKAVTPVFAESKSLRRISRGSLRAEIKRFADLLEFDHERVRLWTFARIMAGPYDNWRQNSLIDVARSIAP